MVAARHKEQLLSDIRTAEDLWNRKELTFPHLRFGTQVREHLDKIDRGRMPILSRKLTRLDDYAAKWPSTKGHMPPWDNLVRPESTTVRNNPDLANQRVFTSATGRKESYFLHTDIGEGGRIHLRINRAKYLVEIGYIGRHLQTKRF